MGTRITRPSAVDIVRLNVLSAFSERSFWRHDFVLGIGANVSHCFWIPYAFEMAF